MLCGFRRLTHPLWAPVDPPKEEVRILSPSRDWGWPMSPRSVPLKGSATEGKDPSLCHPGPPALSKGPGWAFGVLGAQEPGNTRQKSREAS